MSDDDTRDDYTEDDCPVGMFDCRCGRRVAERHTRCGDSSVRTCLICWDQEHCYVCGERIDWFDMTGETGVVAPSGEHERRSERVGQCGCGETHTEGEHP